jgi:hypothetical protein
MFLNSPICLREGGEDASNMTTARIVNAIPATKPRITLLISDVPDGSKK